VAEIVQRRWITGPAGQRCEFYGGSTAIIGPEGQIRYLIRKSITNAQRAATQARHLDSAGPGKTWEGRDGRLFVPQMVPRELHEQRQEMGARSISDVAPVAAIDPAGRRRQRP